MRPRATQEHRAATSSVFYLVLRRIRIPVITIIVIYTFCVVGLSLVPGVDADGNPTPGMGLFHAFYVISYTGTTIGFGELPQPYSVAQRMWMTLSIYLTVVGWSYAVLTTLSLLQEKSFQNAMRASRFARRISGLREPFFIVCGGGETGSLVCHGLDRLGMRFVVVEGSDDRVQELRLEEFNSDFPIVNADAGNPATLRTAGLLSPYCRGVVALVDDGSTNRAIAVSVRLLAPHVPVLARVRDPDVETHIGVFGGELVINPFERFAQHLVAAVAAPEHFLLRETLTGLSGDPLPARHRPPRGNWIMCGYGRFGHAIVTRLKRAGIDVTVIDKMHYGEPGVDIEGTGTDTESLRAAGIERAQGIVAGNADDMKNLAIAVLARELKPDIFIVTRQNQTANTPLFESFHEDLSMVPSRIVAREFLALITTPLLARFLELIPAHTEEWCTDLMGRLQEVRPNRIPEIWSRPLDSKAADAVAQAFARGQRVMVRHLLTDPADRCHTIRALVLLVSRDGSIHELPPANFQLLPGDEVLFAGSVIAMRRLDITLQNINVLDYVRSGSETNGGTVWRWFTRCRRKWMRAAAKSGR